MKRMISRLPLLAPLLLGLLMGLLLPAAAWACPSCKDGLEQGQSNLIQGYFWSILFMMSMPFLIFGGLSTYFYLEVRKARAQKVRQEAALPVTSAKEPVAVA